MSGALIGILAVVGLLLARSNERGPERRSLLCDLTLLTAPMAAIAGWWYLRNLFLYGDPLGWDEMLVLIDAILRRDPSPAALFAEALKLRESSWALFGWGNVGLPDWAYLAFDAVLALSAIGWLLRLRRQPSFPKDGVTPYPLATLLLAGWCAAFALVLARWMAVNEHGGQGRLWFPAIAPFAILFVSGLAGLLPRLPLAGPAAAIAGLGAVAVRRAVAYRAPSVRRTNTTSWTDPPDNVQASFAPGLALVGFRLDPERVAPGQRTMLWLWWRIDRPVDGDLAVRLRVLARDFQPISETVSYPAAGTATFDRLPTGTLPRGWPQSARATRSRCARLPSD
ncbi:MAG: hypothetical protein KatS3mg060_3225 [Dehalococcoidia bacterium]|nr:MAG: hypothetical protein KatS3mg060_3225 [Dehalococcoidia bacterium]